MLRIECTGPGKEGVCYSLLADHVYVVGRKQGELAFPDDQSVSRTHAQLVVQHPAGNITEPHLVPVLSVTDSGSKFGTFASEINIFEKLQISPRESITLPIGEKLRFGLQWNEFRVAYTPFVVTTSSMKSSPEFKSKIVKLGGHMISEWDGNVTHVVMEAITLTVKVVCALLAGKPIVTPVFVSDLLDSFITKKAQPNPKDFLPPVKEREIANLSESTFHPNSARTTLFGGKFFLFCTSKHLKKLSAAIVAGGGTADLISNYVEVETTIVGSEYIIMGQPAEVAIGEKDPKIKVILDTYKRSGKRYIGDSEIGLAAVYNSLEKFCNPKFNMSNAVLPNLITQTQNSSLSSVTIVPATQDLDTQRSSQGNNGTRNVVNETVAQKDDDDDDIVETYSASSRGAKRPVAPVAPETSSAKKRSADEPLTKPVSKRLKEVPSKSIQSPLSPLAQSTRSQTKNSSRARVLTSIFNFSDSDDDMDETPLVAETQPEAHVGAPSDDEGTNVVLDSQSHQSQSEPMVRVVEVRNLQSLRSTQSSTATANTSSGRRGLDEDEIADEDDVLRVPDSPPVTDTLEAAENGRTRNPGTDFIDTITTSIMNAKTIAISSSVPKKPDEEQPSTSRGDSRRKRARDQEEDEKTLSDKTKKMNLTDLKEILREEEAGVVQFIKRPLLNISFLNRNHESILGSKETHNGVPSSKNFKTFKKVLPKFICANRDVSGQENASGRSVTSVLNASIESIRNTKAVKLIPKDYDPGHPKFYGYADTRPPPITEVRQRGEDAETPSAFRDLDSLLAFNPPEPVSTRRTGRRNNGGPIASTSAKNKPSPEPTASSSTQNLNPVATQQKRISPRKKGPSKSDAARMPPPETVHMEEQDKEDVEDDLWTFNR